MSTNLPARLWAGSWLDDLVVLEVKYTDREFGLVLRVPVILVICSSEVCGVPAGHSAL